MIGASGCKGSDCCKTSYMEKNPTGSWQNVYTETCGRLTVLAMKQLNGNLRAFVEFWAGEKLVSRSDGKL